MLSNKLTAIETERGLKAVIAQFPRTNYYSLHYVQRSANGNLAHIIDPTNGRIDGDNRTRINDIIDAFVTIGRRSTSLIYALTGAFGELNAIDALTKRYGCECHILDVRANSAFVYGTDAEKMLMFVMKNQHDTLDLPLRFASLSAQDICDYEE